MKTKILRTGLLLCTLTLTLLLFGGEASKIIPTNLLVGIDVPEKVEAGIDDELEPVVLFSQSLQDAIQLKSLLYRESLDRDSTTLLEQAVDMLSGVGVIEDGERILDEEGYGDIIVSRAEAIKQLVLLNTLRTPVIFNELVYHDGYVPYDDMRRDAWYTSYVQYAYEQSWLDGIDRDGLLKPLHPLTQKEYDRIVKNMGGNHSNSMLKQNQFVTKKDFVMNAVVSYDQQLFSVRTLYGKNNDVYLSLLTTLKDLSIDEQYIHLQKIYDKFTSMDQVEALSTYGISTRGIELMINSILEE